MSNEELVAKRVREVGFDMVRVQFGARRPRFGEPGFDVEREFVVAAETPRELVTWTGCLRAVDGALRAELHGGWYLHETEFERPDQWHDALDRDFNERAGRLPKEA